MKHNLVFLSRMLLMLSVCIETALDAQTTNSTSDYGYPPVLDYQSVITKENGEPYDGNFTVMFQIVNTRNDSILYEETVQELEVSHGLLHHLVGSETGNMDPFIFMKSTALRITVDDEILSPDVRIAPSPVALVALYANTLIGGETHQADAADRIRIQSPDTAIVARTASGPAILANVGINTQTSKPAGYSSSDALFSQPFLTGALLGISDDQYVAGISGYSSFSAGVSGYSKTNIGLFGTSESYDGVFGISNTASGRGVYGSNAKGVAVMGISGDSVGVFGESCNSVGVFGKSNLGLAGHFDGHVGIWGNFNVAGSKNVMVMTNDDGQRNLYSDESTEVYFFDRGQSQLNGGVATIHLDPMFLSTVTIDERHPMLVQVTLTDACEGIYVSERTMNSFTVKELKGGISSAKFIWEVAAKRRGYESLRLEPCLLQNIPDRDK